MLLSREEMTFDFQGARLDPVRDRELLEWMFNQFLYGEVTGIQVGHWLYAAPDLDAARFLAKQAVEEMQHVGNFLRIMKELDCEPKPAHPVIRFLSTGMMGDSWEEHCAIEMAAGEGFVLLAFYALIDGLDHQPTVDILKRAVRQEESHVDFGEQQTMKAIEGRPWVRRRLAGLNLVSIWGVNRLAKWMQKRLPGDNEVMARLPDFLAHANRCAELRMQRLGLIDRPLAELGRAHKLGLVASAYGAKTLGAGVALATWPLRLLGVSRQRRLTDSYLQDPHVQAAFKI